jgi:hypothetical protein
MPPNIDSPVAPLDSRDRLRNLYTGSFFEYMSAARGVRLGDYDFSIIFDVLARMSGIDTGR